MKRNDIKALADKSVAELNKQLQELQLQVAKARLEKSVGKLENLRLVSSLSDDVARIKTVLREKQLAEETVKRTATKDKETTKKDK